MGAMSMYLTIERPGLFLQRERPGNEPGNSLWHPEVSLEVAVLLYGVLGAFSVERAYCINSINRTPRGATPERQGGPHLVDGKLSR